MPSGPPRLWRRGAAGDRDGGVIGALARMRPAHARLAAPTGRIWSCARARVAAFASCGASPPSLGPRVRSTDAALDAIGFPLRAHAACPRSMGPPLRRQPHSFGRIGPLYDAMLAPYDAMIAPSARVVAVSDA